MPSFNEKSFTRALFTKLFAGTKRRERSSWCTRPRRCVGKFPHIRVI